MSRSARASQLALTPSRRGRYNSTHDSRGRAAAVSGRVHLPVSRWPCARIDSSSTNPRFRSHISWPSEGRGRTAFPALFFSCGRALARDRRAPRAGGCYSRRWARRGARRPRSVVFIVQAAEWLEATWLSTAIRESIWVYPIVESIHVRHDCALPRPHRGDGRAPARRGAARDAGRRGDGAAAAVDPARLRGDGGHRPAALRRHAGPLHDQRVLPDQAGACSGSPDSTSGCSITACIPPCTNGAAPRVRRGTRAWPAPPRSCCGRSPSRPGGSLPTTGSNRSRACHCTPSSSGASTR